MKKLCCLLLLAFASLSLPAYAEPLAAVTFIPIPSLPTIITKPGNYYFVANMYFQVASATAPSVAITVNAPGPVTIDMRGFTLSSQTRFLFQPGYVTVDPTAISILSSDVTVRNGEISGFWNGLLAAGTGNASVGTYLSRIHLEKVKFLASDNEAVGLTKVNNSVVRDCDFTETYAGIQDYGSQTGNTYINDKVGNANDLYQFHIQSFINNPIVYTINVTSETTNP